MAALIVMTLASMCRLFSGLSALPPDADRGLIDCLLVSQNLATIFGLLPRILLNQAQSSPSRSCECVSWAELRGAEQRSHRVETELWSISKTWGRWKDMHGLGRVSCLGSQGD